MSLFNRTIDRINNAAPTVRAYVRVTFKRLWHFSVATIVAGAYGALGTWCFGLNGWPAELGVNLAFWPALVALWGLVIGGIRHNVRTGM